MALRLSAMFSPMVAMAALMSSSTVLPDFILAAAMAASEPSVPSAVSAMLAASA